MQRVTKLRLHLGDGRLRLSASGFYLVRSRPRFLQALSGLFGVLVELDCKGTLHGRHIGVCADMQPDQVAAQMDALDQPALLRQLTESLGEQPRLGALRYRAKLDLNPKQAGRCRRHGCVIPVNF